MAVQLSVAGGSPAWQRGVRAILEGGGYRVEVFRTVLDWAPGVGGSAVVVRADSESAAEAITKHSETYPYVPVVAIVEGSSVTQFAHWIRAGSSVVVDETHDLEQLPTTVAAVLQGRGAVPIPVLQSMAEAIPSAPEMVDQLSEEEISWLRSMAEGLTVIELADRAGYSQRAMFRLLRKLYMRLGVPNRTSALLWASRVGLLS